MYSFIWCDILMKWCKIYFSLTDEWQNAFCLLCLRIICSSCIKSCYCCCCTMSWFLRVGVEFQNWLHVLEENIEESWGFFFIVFWMNDIVVPPTGTFTKCCIVCKSEWWVEWDIYVPHGWNVIWIVHPKLSPSCILLTLMSFQTMIYFLYFVEHKFSSTEWKCMETKGWQALKRTTTKNTKYRFFIKLSFYITFKVIQVFVRRRW